MSQTINYDKNPSAEGAAARVSRVAATTSLSADTFTSWPPSGTKSHKLVATAATVSTAGLPNADRPAASSGQVWSARCVVRNSAAGVRTIAVRIVFYDTAGATLGTALSGSVTTSSAFAAGEIKTVTVIGAVAPASTASVDLQVERTAAGLAATSDPVHADQFTLTQTADALLFADPSDSSFTVWSGATDASTSIYYVPEITLDPLTDAAPSPRCIVTIDDMPPAVDQITLFRYQQGRTFKVRGSVLIGVDLGYSTPDVEAPFQRAFEYRAQMFGAGGADLGFTVAAASYLDVTDCWIHNPTDPEGALLIDITDSSGRSIVRPSDGQIVYPQNRQLGVLIAGPRRGITGTELYFESDTVAAADTFQAMLGSYADDDPTVPILCIRTPPLLRLPSTLFAAVQNLSENAINAHMSGDLTGWSATVDEVSPPFPGLVVPLLTRDDIDIFFATRALMDAAYLRRIDIDRDYSKAGLA